ncbi:MAG: tRNA epoxyqueuosine(34) reductase QueG [Bdellovibrionaceae bacterium]|nr:tRNA epoxyqueuosine(34) reductase QueG [Pseudobdellovibrionaceae bacterium]
MNIEIDLNPLLESLAQEQGFSLVGWAPLEKPLSFDLYRQWISEGRHGEMTYLENHLPWKEHPQSRYPFAQTAFVFAIPYRPHPAPAQGPLNGARIASYAKGGDYHHWLKDRLSKIAFHLKEKFPEHEFETHTDSSPLLERDLAIKAGLGWVGKNTCVIDRKAGSFFLLGEILSSLPWAGPSPGKPTDFCGTCTRCLDACPTGALVEPRLLDARKCISYMSIESREIPPEDLREKWGDWLFGCDICQSVCPWNAKPFQIQNEEKVSILNLGPDQEAALLQDLRWILSSSGKQIEKAFRGTALSRAGGFGLKRNALIVGANRKITALLPDIDKMTEHPRLSNLAKWARQRIIDA